MVPSLDSGDGRVGPSTTAPTAPARRCRDATPPYANGVAALRDGWMLLQSSQLTAPTPGNEHLNDYLDYEFVFERRVDVL